MPHITPAHAEPLLRALRCLNSPGALAVALALAENPTEPLATSTLRHRTGMTNAQVNNALKTLHGNPDGRAGGILLTDSRMAGDARGEKFIHLNPDAYGLPGFTVKMLTLMREAYDATVASLPVFDPDDDFDSIDPDDLFPDD